MEKKEVHNTTTTKKPIGSICERLFTALNTNNTFRPLRRLTYWQQNPEPQSETQSNNSYTTAASDAKHKIPSPPPPEKPKVITIAPSFAKNDVKDSYQKDAPAVTNKKDAKATQQNAIAVPVPPKGVTMPPKGNDRKDAPVVSNTKDAKGAQLSASVPVPPKGVTWQQLAPPKGAIIPLPTQPTGAAGSTDTPDSKPKKSLNEKVEDYIHRTKRKLRSTTLARTQTTK